MCVVCAGVPKLVCRQGQGTKGRPPSHQRHRHSLFMMMMLSRDHDCVPVPWAFATHRPACETSIRAPSPRAFTCLSAAHSFKLSPPTNHHAQRQPPVHDPPRLHDAIRVLDSSVIKVAYCTHADPRSSLRANGCKGRWHRVRVVQEWAHVYLTKHAPACPPAIHCRRARLQPGLSRPRVQPSSVGTPGPTRSLHVLSDTRPSTVPRPARRTYMEWIKSIISQPNRLIRSQERQ